MMRMVGGPASEVEYLFVDRGCLRAQLRRWSERYAGGAALEIDWNRFRGGYQKVFVYDAVPAGPNANEATAEPIRRELAEIRAVTGYHVPEGDLRRADRGGRRGQKKVDILIAVDMLTHAFRRNMARCTLLAGDLDFEPLLNALALEGMFVNLWYPNEPTTLPELIGAAAGKLPLLPGPFKGVLKPESQKIFRVPDAVIQPPTGEVHVCRVQWEDPTRGRCIVMQSDVLYIMVAPDPNNPGMSLYASHAEIEPLRHFARESFNLEIPTLDAG